MKLYLEKLVQGHYANVSFYAALEAYHRMGFDVEEVTDFDGLEIEEPNIFLGSIQFVEQALEYLNIEMPQPLDYPEELQEFLGRKIWISTINEIAGNPENWNVFVKPRGFAKKFTGRYIQSTKDLVGCGDLKMNTPVWVSEPKSFVAEWRVFVRYGRVLSVRSYKGDWRTNYDAEIIQKAVDSYTNAPAGYAL
ncbi:MAG: ATP-grasp domain-containing protein, partial [Saprospiraceae bacterium]